MSAPREESNLGTMVFLFIVSVYAILFVILPDDQYAKGQIWVKCTGWKCKVIEIRQVQKKNINYRVLTPRGHIEKSGTIDILDGWTLQK